MSAKQHADAEPLYYSTARVSRKLDIPPKQIFKAIEAGRLRPCTRATDRLFLFHRSRLPEIAAVLETQPKARPEVSHG